MKKVIFSVIFSMLVSMGAINLSYALDNSSDLLELSIAGKDKDKKKKKKKKKCCKEGETKSCCEKEESKKSCEGKH